MRSCKYFLRLEPLGVLFARVGFAFAYGDLTHFAAVQCCTPAPHDQLELVRGCPAIGLHGTLSWRGVVASAKCTHEFPKCHFRIHVHR